MNHYVKQFFLRGLLFGGFGPIVVGIVYAILEKTVENFSLSGSEVLVAILSTYLLAFLQAGASVFQQIEHWSIGRALLFHFTTVFFAYAGCYLVNAWIPFEWRVLLIFAAVFIVTYFIIWITVFLSVKAVEKRLNANLK